MYNVKHKLSYSILANIANQLPLTDAGDQRYLCFLLSCKSLRNRLDKSNMCYRIRFMDHNMRQRPYKETLKPKEEICYRVDRILCEFYLHACDLPNYYEEDHEPEYYYDISIQKLIAGKEKPKVEFAADFTNWKPVPVTNVIEPDLFSRYDRFNGTDSYLWPAFCINFVLPPGQYQYKFIVNEVEWTYTKQSPLVFDHDGNLNNYLDTTQIKWDLSAIEQETNPVWGMGWNLVTELSSFLGHTPGFDIRECEEEYSWLPPI